MKKIVLACVSASILLGASPVFAANLAKACKADLKKFGCKAKTDPEVHECLEKHEDESKPNEGFSEKCGKAHEVYEKKTGQAEKGEEHPSE